MIHCWPGSREPATTRGSQLIGSSARLGSTPASRLSLSPSHARASTASPRCARAARNTIRARQARYVYPSERLLLPRLTRVCVREVHLPFLPSLRRTLMRRPCPSSPAAFGSAFQLYVTDTYFFFFIADEPWAVDARVGDTLEINVLMY